MQTINLTQNFNTIYDTLQKKHMNITGIAKSMGYTSSNQLHSALKGESMLSTKAIVSLIENANVNPLFLFFGKGDVFLTDETEIEKLKKENQEWIQRHNEAVKTIMELNEIIKKLEKRNDDLIEISSAAIKYHQGKKDEEVKAEEK
jgi:esterase/lipase